MLNTIGKLAIALMFLGVAFGCVSEQAQSNSDPVATTAFASRPAQKTTNITIEGETEPIRLELYDNAAAPFITYFPAESVLAEGGCSHEGCGFHFSAKTETGEANDAAYLHFFFPSEALTIAQIEASYLQGEGSPFASTDNWQRIETSAQSPQYPWVKKSMHFLDSDRNRTGRLMIGEAEGRIFVAIEVIEAEYVEGFAPRLATIYENLELRAPAARP